MAKSIENDMETWFTQGLRTLDPEPRGRSREVFFLVVVIIARRRTMDKKMEITIVYSMCEMLGPDSPEAACTSIWAFLPKRALGTTEVQELQRDFGD